MFICCNALKETVEDLRVYISYDDRYREYYIETTDPVVIYVIKYCPWCSKKLPENLTDEWFKALETEYGLDDPDSKEQQNLVPNEFKTDEWWKKRGY